MDDSLLDAVEDLDDDAILAHAAPIHAPPGRALVRVARRTVVIAEGGTRDRTVVVSRRALAQERRGFRRLRPWLVWGAAGVTAFAAGGMAASVLSALRAPIPVVSAPKVSKAKPPVEVQQAPEQAPGPHVVSVGDLPLEPAR